MLLCTANKWVDMRLLLVEDDVMVASGIKLGLTDAGYAVAIIDIGLPAMDGLELTRRLRRPDMASPALPVLILTARDALHDRVQGLDLGADDYMVKPFELPELLARLRALLRRSQAATAAVLSFGPLELDTAGRRASIRTGDGEQVIELGPREWTVLEYLLINAPKPASKDKLLQALTGWDKEITPNAVEVYVSRLRGKLEPHGVALRSIRGFGYRLEHQAAWAEPAWLKPWVRIMMTPPDRAIPSPRPGLRAMTSDLRNRLLILLVLPLCALALVGVWLGYRSADEAAGRHDQRLLRLLPALADSVLAPSIRDHEPPLLLLAPPVEDFLRQNTGFAGYSVRDISGRLLLGDDWVHSAVPTTHAPEFHSVEFGGVTYRVAVQRGRTGAGELVVALADGSDPRQQWAQQLLLRVLLPNLVLVAAAALAIHWAVGRAFKPLVDLAEAVEHRSPRDLSPIDEASSPAEARPLVHSLNRLFALVNAQAKGAIVLGVDQIEKLRNATRRTSQLAHQLLALSRADARSLDAQPPQRVDLKDLCETLLETFLDPAT